MAVYIQSGEIDLGDSAKSDFLAVFHGGAGPADPKGEKAKTARDSVFKIAQSLQSRDLSKSPTYKNPNQPTSLTPAEAIVLEGAKLLEEDPIYNAGRGAAIQEDGIIRVSASFMESTRLKFSAVVNLQEILHPSQLAHYLQGERFCMLDSFGGQNLAKKLDVPLENLVTPRKLERWKELKAQSTENHKAADRTGTIGCVSVSLQGNQPYLAAVTSTGGVGHETPGRIGDTPSASGNYCTSKAAVSCTGIGEQIVSQSLASRICIRVEDGMSLKEAVQKSLNECDHRGFQLAIISVAFDAKSNHAHWVLAGTPPTFIWGVATRNQIRTFADDMTNLDVRQYGA